MSSIIGNVGRKSLKVRILNVVIHVMLFLGALTMIYPFMVMLSGSIKSTMDFKYFDIIPAYLVNTEALFHKYLFSKFNGKTDLAMMSLNERVPSVEKINMPAGCPESISADFDSFMKNPPNGVNDFCYGVGFASEPGYYPLMNRRFVEWLKKQYGDFQDGLYKMNRDLDTEYSNWDEVLFPVQNFTVKKVQTDYTRSKIFAKFKAFKDTQSPAWTMYIMNIDGYFAQIIQRDFGKKLEKVNADLGMSWVSWNQVVAFEKCPSESPKLAKFWEKFVRKELNAQFIGVTPEALPAYRNFLRAQYAAVDKLNAAHGTKLKSFDEAQFLDPAPVSGAALVDLNEFIASKAPVESLRVKGFNYYFRNFAKAKYGNVAALNKNYHFGYAAFSEIPLSDSEPENNLTLKKDWGDFVSKLNIKDVSLKRSSVFEYKKYIGEIYGAKSKDQQADLKTMSADYKQTIAAAEDIPAFQAYPETSTLTAKTHYEGAVKSEARFKELRVIKNPAALKGAWAAFLQDKYKDIDKFNLACGYLPSSFETMPIPVKEWELNCFMRHKGEIKFDFVWRNYAMVIDTILINGKAASNTLIYCVLAVLAALIVNPLAAYALSRWRPPSSYKILLILMLTMAFPPMVIGIPNFLTLKNFGLLNTFAALILPGMASGYSIFLLKGFFDSLPKELFECATLDGAGEWTMFWHIAMTLSKPILAVIALGAFLGAYGNFMMAFIVCQDPDMWTMMVYLYQLQQRAGPAVGFAALVVAAVPTLLVFIFCQNIIIKGIVVPTEK